MVKFRAAMRLVIALSLMMVVRAMPAKAEQETAAATTVTEWVAQIEESRVQITNVRVEATDAGLQVLLETADGTLAEPTTSVSGNALILEIPNAVLAGDGFEEFSPAEGIALVQVSPLAGDRVQVAITGADAAPEVTVGSDAAGLALSVVPGVTQVSQEDDEAIQIVVTGEVGTRTETALRDVPQSIQVIPQPVIEEQNALRLGEALRNASGVVTTTGRAQEGDGVYIRGFGGPFNSSFLRNGIRDENGQSIIADPVNIERVEILKGPASVLFGEVAPGGTVNIITERPLSEPSYDVEVAAGNFDFYRGTLDLTGPLNESESVLYRLNAAAQTSDSFIDFFNEERYFVGPTLSFRFGDHTELTLEGEYQETDSPGYFGLPASGTVINNPNGDLPLDLFTGEPDESKFNIQTYRFGYDLEHRFSDNWQLRNAFQLTDRDFNGTQIGLTGFQPDNRTADRFYFENVEPFSVRNYTLDTYVTGEFSTGSIEHQLVAGFELARSETNTNGIFGDAGPLDLFDPVYGQPLGSGTLFNSLQTNDSLGIYLQDQIDLTDNLILLLGGRFDIVNQTFEDFVTDSETSQQDEAFSPRIGIVYQPIEPISLYASYSQSFQQIVGSALDNSAFDPERGTQYEIGVKGDITDRLSATLALYDLTRTNVLTEDPNDPIFSIQSGRQRSRGVELDRTAPMLLIADRLCRL
ncbi:MAG: TonB-dependent siderophore receptor, partial [Cyanobacteria bacterium J06649_4]